MVARFVGQQRLYFGLATYRDGDRSTPVSLRLPDRGSLYVSLAGLTGRGLRRTVRGPAGNGYGTSGVELGWGGDNLDAAPAADTEEPARRTTNGSGAVADTGYSDGYSDDLWNAPATQPEPAGTVASQPPAAEPTPAATAQGLAARRRPASRALLVEPYYQPEDWWDALTTQLAHFARGAMWFLGVADTTRPPYSAICQVRIPDGSAEGRHHGTAFFIAPRLLLTAAHVVDGQGELIIVPGKNGAGTGSANEPFGRFRATVFRKHPDYGADGHGNDMALIQVPAANAAAAPNYFGLVEELTQSRPEGVVVSGYAAWWHAVSAIEHFVNANIDENRQHAHGGHIRELIGEGTFTYDLQTLAGTSGSPVYWIESGAHPVAHLVGVHVAANDNRTNAGCRITQEKLAWIRSVAAEWGQTLGFALGTGASGRPARALDAQAHGDSTHDIGGPIPDASGAAAQGWAPARGLSLSAPEYPQASRFEPAHPGNYRSVSGTRTIDRIVIHITDGGRNISGPVSWFKNPEAKVSAHYIVGQDGEIVQMVAHKDVAWHAGSANATSIGIEHVANTRGLLPTPQQLAASAALVDWLCQQYGIPADREHVLGHAEADTRTTHRACPNAVWDWDYYMGMVTSRSSYMPTAQGLGHHARALEVIQPYYDPSDPHRALACTDDAMSREFEEWFVGVDDTRQFPHSAICMLEMAGNDGYTYRGTGFYIGRNRILTCAHNLHDCSQVTIFPGLNGAGNLPFGSATVPASSWRIAPGYAGSGDWTNDLAVIGNVPIAAPHDMWFEFLQATPAGSMRLAVCGYSTAGDAIPGLTNLIDGYRQHLHGGTGAYQASLETIDYPILSLRGASGSPVYAVRNEGGVLKAKVCAVHVSGQPADTDHVNRGCFITPRKIDWIEGRASSFALGAPSRALQSFSVHWTDVPMNYQTSPMSCWAAAAAMVAGWREGLCFPDSDVADKVPALDAFRRGLHPRDRVLLADAWNLYAEPPASYTIEAWRQMLESCGPLYIDQTANIAGQGGHVRVLVGMDSDGAPDGSGTTMYMHDPARGPIKLSYAAFLELYERRTANSGPFLQLQVLHAGGVPEGRRTSTTAAFALGVHARAQESDGPSDYPVHLIPQPDKNACWAASMAMLLSYRRSQSIEPETVVREVGGSLATSYDLDLLEAVKSRYGFQAIEMPSSASLYHSPRQWARWLQAHGPLWVVIVGAPHAVVVAGIRGDLDDPAATQVKVLNPWDVRVAFDQDPIAFNPPNRGYEDWIDFAEFASDFGEMAEPDYGNWRVLYLPAASASAQSLGARGGLRLAAPPPRVVVALDAQAGERREPIEPSRVPGTAMARVIGEAGANRWRLDQLEGMKSPGTQLLEVSSAEPGDTRITLDDWPAIEDAPTPLPLAVEFRHDGKAVGDVRITAGTPADLAYGVDVSARIEDCADADADGVARLRVRIDYRFRGLAQGNPDATVELALRGDGRYERENAWRNVEQLTSAA
ncbi:papain-like cysteine protease family protein [Pseudoxanthomonas suwonensis]|uniref:papain-like cysteine protease family protein n=1 Tax=Pseudoxanthomonas suwonensis TaxID=314722 RepID=UPI00138F181B|nr:papain-like cysteine protease family protein [Pseudoxanthomonas suwonensis]